MCASHGVLTKPKGAMKVKVSSGVPRQDAASSLVAALPARLSGFVREAEQERTRWDPKDGELCLSRAKSEETLMEARSDSDVQIDRQTWI
jgi:hypothetical protein